MSGGDGLRWPVAVLAKNQVRLATARVVALERVGPVQQDHHVAILLQRSRFAQVREHWLLIGSLLWAAIELADRDNRNVKLLGHQFDAAREIGHFLLTKLVL